MTEHSLCVILLYMKVLELNSIVGEDTLIYYRRNYTAVARLEFFAKTEDVKISFTIETNPLGNKLIYLEYPFGITFDYPVVPVTTSIKEKILTMDNEGALPL